MQRLEKRPDYPATRHHHPPVGVPEDVLISISSSWPQHAEAGALLLDEEVMPTSCQADTAHAGLHAHASPQLIAGSGADQPQTLQCADLLSEDQLCIAPASRTSPPSCSSPIGNGMTAAGHITLLTNEIPDPLYEQQCELPMHMQHSFASGNLDQPNRDPQQMQQPPSNLQAGHLGPGTWVADQASSQLAVKCAENVPGGIRHADMQRALQPDRPLLTEVLSLPQSAC